MAGPNLEPRLLQCEAGDLRHRETNALAHSPTEPPPRAAEEMESMTGCPLQGKIRENRELCENMSGKYQGIFSYILYIPGMWGYRVNGETIREKSGKNQGICFTKLSGHPAMSLLM